MGQEVVAYHLLPFMSSLLLFWRFVVPVASGRILHAFNRF